MNKQQSSPTYLIKNSHRQFITHRMNQITMGSVRYLPDMAQTCSPSCAELKGLVEEPGNSSYNFLPCIAYLASLYNGLSFSANGDRQK